MFWFLPGELNCLLILNALSNKLMFMLVTGISASLENMLIFPLFNKSKLHIWDAFLNVVCVNQIFLHFTWFHLHQPVNIVLRLYIYQGSLVYISPHVQTPKTTTTTITSVYKPTHSNFQMHNMLGRVSDTGKVHIKLNTAAITLNQSWRDLHIWKPVTSL